MVNNVLRHGNCTSSEIVCLTKTGSRDMTPEELKQHKEENPKSRKTKIESWPGKAALTYIRETNMERRLERSLTDESNARPLSWGKLCEYLVFLLLDTAYILTSTETVLHKIIRWWAGSPDGEKTDTVIDIKAPFTLKSFCVLVQPLYDGLQGWEAMCAIRDGYTDKNGFEHDAHPDGEKYYWQLVSNAILLKKKYAELIVFMPYKSEIEAIKAEAMKEKYGGKYFWVSMANEGELPFLPEDGYYKNINIIRFEVPEADKLLLTKRVLQAGQMLVNNDMPNKMLIEWNNCTGSDGFIDNDDFVKSVYNNDLKYERLYEAVVLNPYDDEPGV